MKVGFVSAPLTATSGYGKVAKEICFRLADLGYDIVNIGGRMQTVVLGERLYLHTDKGNRVLVVPAWGQTGDPGTIQYYINRYGIDVILSLYDAYVHTFGKPSKPWAMQCPIDTELTTKWVNYLLNADYIVAMSRFGERELLKHFPDFMIRYIPHGCLDAKTQVHILGDNVLGVKGDRYAPIKVKDVWKIRLLDTHLVELITEQGKMLRITRDNLILTNEGWVPAGDIKVNDKVAVWDEEPSLYTTMDIQDYVDTYESLDVGGRGDPLEKLHKGESHGGSTTSRKKLFFHHTQSSSNENKDEKNCIQQTLDRRGAKNSIGELLEDDDAGNQTTFAKEDRGSHNSKSNEIKRKQVSSKTKGKVVYQNRGSLPRRMEVGVPSGLFGWRGEYINIEDPKQLLSQNESIQQLRSNFKRIAELDRGVSAEAWRKQTISASGIQVSFSNEQCIQNHQASATLPINKEKASGACHEVLGIEKGKIYKFAPLTRGRENRSGNQKIKYEKIVRVRLCPPSSPYVYDLITQTGNFIANGIVVHNCDTAVFKPRSDEERLEIRRKWKIPEDDFVFLDVAANWGERKSLPQLLITFKRFLERHGDAKLFLYTNLVEQCPTGFDLMEIARELGISEKVLGPKFNPILDSLEDEQLAELYCASDVYVSASLGEGFGLPLLEAMACGVPCIAPKNSQVELVEGHGWLVENVPREMWEAVPVWIPMGARYPVPNLSSLLQCMEEAYNKGDERRRFGRESREFALQYDWGRLVDKWDSLIREMAEVV
jgi:glycosyltransferase involved in cell wall biosynthesis